MNINEMIEFLEEYRDEHGGEQQVMLAIQPTWPFEYEVAGIGATPDGTVYIGQGAQMGYLPHDAAVALDWVPEEV